jgi:hypothetical protein
VICFVHVCVSLSERSCCLGGGEVCRCIRKRVYDDVRMSPSQESCCLKGGVWCLCLRMCVCVCVFVCVTCLYISFEQVDTHAGIAPKRMHALYTVTVNFANLHTTHNVAPHTHTRTHTHAYSRTHTHTRTHARTHTYTCTHINMLTHTLTHTHMHTPLQV